MKRMMIAMMIMAGMMIAAGPAAAQNEPEVTHTVVMKTALGDITLELYGKDAPKTVANFTQLAERRFYDGVLFHRVVPGFVIQAGDPQTKDTTLRTQWGTGGSSIYDGKVFEDELNPNAPSYKMGYSEGTLAMANRGPNTNTSQFFIVLNNNAKLQKLYTIFGRVTQGMDVAHQIETVALRDRQTGLPVKPVAILEVTVYEGRVVPEE